MITRTGPRGILAAAVLLAMTGPGFAQASADDHDAHHPEAGAAEGAAAPGGGAPDAGITPMQGGTGMMLPETMPMMGEGRAPGMMGGMPHGQMGGTMGPGMMGGNAMPMEQMMRGHGLGPGALYGLPQGAVPEMTPARVETFLSHLLERHGNPRLELGDISEAEDGSITAEIVTIDGSVVQRLSFNRYPGLFRQID